MGVCMGKDDKVVHQDTRAQSQQQKVLAERQYKAKQGNQMSEQDKATIQLKQVQDQLNKRLKQIENGMIDADEEAKTHLRNGNKQRAKYALERKQLYVKYEENVLNQDKVINKTLRDVQEAFDNAATAQTLKNANKLMIDINKAIDIDEMKDAADNLQDLEANNKQFTQLYSQYVGADSDEITKQIDKMEAELFENQLNQHVQHTQKPILTQKHQQISPQKEQQHVQQVEQKQTNFRKKESIAQDELDKELAMLI